MDYDAPDEEYVPVLPPRSKPIPIPIPNHGLQIVSVIDENIAVYHFYECVDEEHSCYH